MLKVWWIKLSLLFFVCSSMEKIRGYSSALMFIKFIKLSQTLESLLYVECPVDFKNFEINIIKAWKWIFNLLVIMT